MGRKKLGIYNDKDKLCGICNKWLPHELFGKRNDSYTGLDCYCKKCRNEYSKKYNRRAHRHKARYGLTENEYNS